MYTGYRGPKSNGAKELGLSAALRLFAHLQISRGRKSFSTWLKGQVQGNQRLREPWHVPFLSLKKRTFQQPLETHNRKSCRQPKAKNRTCSSNFVFQQLPANVLYKHTSTGKSSKPSKHKFYELVSSCQYPSTQAENTQNMQKNWLSKEYQALLLISWCLFLSLLHLCLGLPSLFLGFLSLFIGFLSLLAPSSCRSGIVPLRFLSWDGHQLFADQWWRRILGRPAHVAGPSGFCIC